MSEERAYSQATVNCLVVFVIDVVVIEVPYLLKYAPRRILNFSRPKCGA